MAYGNPLAPHGDPARLGTINCGGCALLPRYYRVDMTVHQLQDAPSEFAPGVHFLMRRFRFDGRTVRPGLEENQETFRHQAFCHWETRLIYQPGSGWIKPAEITAQHKLHLAHSAAEEAEEGEGQGDPGGWFLGPDFPFRENPNSLTWRAPIGNPFHCLGKTWFFIVGAPFLPLELRTVAVQAFSP